MVVNGIIGEQVVPEFLIEGGVGDVRSAGGEKLILDHVVLGGNSACLAI